jgi:cellulose synthase/poly-beta-1,6-N-acetylglucosamine synthase-like glycosyltransferase
VPETYIPNAHKKRAIRYGIENAKGEIIITSDADCNYNNNWLRTLLKYMDDKTAFISGPVEFEDNGNIFGAIQKLEFAGLVIVGAGLIGINRPTICNAANIAYRRKVFDEVNGFYDQFGLSSGDDELLMQKIWKETNYKIKFCPEKSAIVKTAPNKTLTEFYQQRKRWASKGLFYKNKLLVLKLILIYLFYLSLPIQLILGIIKSPVYFITLAAGLILKILVEFLVLKFGIILLFERKILRKFLPAQILQIPYIIVAGFAGTFGNFIWKERKVSR